MVLGSAAADIAMSSIAVLFLIHSYVAKDWAWAKETWVRCLLLIWLYMLLRGAVADYKLYTKDDPAFAANPFEALRRSLPFVRYFVFAAALARWTLTDDINRRRFFNALTIAVVFLAADCLLQWCTGKDIAGRMITQSEGRVRLTGPFRNPMPGILLAWLYFLVCMPLLINENGALESNGVLLKGVILTLFIWVMIAMTGERMALLLVFAGWLLAVLLLPGMRRGLLMVFAGGIVIIGIIALASPKVVGHQMQATTKTIEHLQESPYGVLLRTDLKLAMQNPVFGIGANYFRIDCPKLYPGYSEQMLKPVCNIHPHNIYMEWLIESGIVGFGLFIAFLAIIIRQCIRAWPVARTNPYFIGAVITFVQRIWPFATTTTFFSPWGAPPFWLVISLLLVYTAQAEEALPKRLS